MLSAGQKIGHFEVLEKIGAGGMGVVYKARDVKLDRLVALKVLQPARGDDTALRARLVREARAASSLNHPNIVVVYEADSADGVDFIAMEFVAGEVLSRMIPPEGMRIADAVAVAQGVAAALSASHAAGVVHRDLKPGNVMVRPDGVVKVMDFGLAKAVAVAGSEQEATVTAGDTAVGTVLGTGPYMSPEQAEGKPVDPRSDIFSFGAVFYEMLTGRRAFQGDTIISTISSVIKDTPAPPHHLRPEVVPDLERVVARCLEKNREARYASGTELSAALAGLDMAGPRPRRRPFLAAAAALVIVLANGTWWGVRQWRARWVYRQAIPEIYRLAADSKILEAYRLGVRAEQILPGDPELERAMGQCSQVQRVVSEPPGASVYYRPYIDPSAPEQLAGRTSAALRFPLQFLRLRLVKNGFQDAEASMTPGAAVSLILEPNGAQPPGMVTVPAGSDVLDGRRLNLPPFRLDKHEVTNLRFKSFVDQGGYRKREYWKFSIVKDGREISWEEAMRLFVDGTGRPGPATWELGSYPETQADYPVGGVSWYEAAAYAEFSGQSLPTVAHWQRAADFGYFSEILQFSNFSGQGPAPAGKYRGVGSFGTYDMAGNVKEWCFNAVGNYRALLGGSWNDAAYKYRDFNAADPLERLPADGFRCAKYLDAPPAEAFDPIHQSARDPGKEKPVSEETFRAYHQAFAYDRTPLDARVEAADDSSEYYRREKISYAAAYGGERVLAWLFLPKNVSPPYQTVVYYPSAESLRQNSSDNLGQQRYLLFVIRSGRALLVPIYKGTYERIVPPPTGPNGARELLIQRGKDLGRSIDYLETRPDIDHTRLAYYGISMGAVEGAIMTAVEPRFRAAILAWGGIRTTPVARRNRRGGLRPAGEDSLADVERP